MWTYTLHTQIHIHSTHTDTHYTQSGRGETIRRHIPKPAGVRGGLDEVGRCVNTTTQRSRFHCSNEVFVVKVNIWSFNIKKGSCFKIMGLTPLQVSYSYRKRWSRAVFKHNNTDQGFKRTMIIVGFLICYFLDFLVSWLVGFLILNVVGFFDFPNGSAQT